MADDGYYRDQPRFERKDPLDRWAWMFLGLAGLALLWFLLIILLTATGRLANDELFGLSEGFWVGVSTILVIVAVLGLVFVIVGRLGAASSGSYLSADLRRPRREEQAVEEPPAPQTAPSAEETALSESDMLASQYGLAPRPEVRAAARIDDPFGPDGRMLLSYTVPTHQPRGIYGDTWVTVDTDAVLNVKSLLAKTIGGTRGD